MDKLCDRPDRWSIENALNTPVKTLYLHGLGQTPDSWRDTLLCIGEENSYCPALPQLLQGKEATYENLYSAFASDCGQEDAPMILCGLSLGAVLALHYACEHPRNVKALILIAPQYKMPKRLLQFQNMLFHFLPKNLFPGEGFSKADFIILCRSMMDLDFTDRLSHIPCPTLVICGERDSANRKAAEKLIQLTSKAQLKIIPNAGHEVNTEAPEVLARMIREFYDSLE